MSVHFPDVLYLYWSPSATFGIFCVCLQYLHIKKKNEVHNKILYTILILLFSSIISYLLLKILNHFIQNLDKTITNIVNKEL